MFKYRPALAVLCLFFVITAFPGLAWSDEVDIPAVKPRPVTSLPKIAPVIHNHMQSREFEAAMAVIDQQLQDNDTDDPDYLLYLKGIALTELQTFDKAISVLQSIEEKHPDSRWISLARFGQAHIHVTRRDYVKAGTIYQQEAERLLSRDRKDELVAIYQEFADRYFEGIPANDPSQAKKPDFAQALTYYSEAVKLGPTTQLRQKIEFRIARCLEETDKHAEAITAFHQFLQNYSGEIPKSGLAAASELLAEARYRQGSAQLAAGQKAEARKTWQTLLKEQDKAEPSEATAEFLTKAQYRLAHTYGLPTPSSVGDLELAVALAEQFLAANPDHKLAAVAELEIAQGLQQHGRHVQAVKRLRSLIENPKYTDADQVPVASRMLGQVYLAQQQFEEAITAWKAFLDHHPTDSQWPAVQKQIVDAEYARAAFALGKKEYEQARTQWQTFLNKYPLDSRAASVLQQFGQMKYAEAVEKHGNRISAALKKGESAQSVKLNKACRTLFEEAIADWRLVMQKYPQSSEASNAAMMIGVTLEDRLGQLNDALKAYEQVVGPRQEASRQRIARLTAAHLEIVTERKFRSDETPRIKLTTRNLETVSVKVYRIDMTDYFRKMHLATGIEQLDIALIDPDLQFEQTVNNYEEYRSIVGDIEIDTDGPGVTAVTVSSDKLEATTMVVVSDLDIIVKSSRNELFLFAQNMRTGKPASGVSVLVSDGAEVFAEEITDDDGVLQQTYEQLKSVEDLRVFAVQTGHVASTVNHLNGLDFAVGLSPQGYLYTDRPAYRSGQLVNIKGIVRWVAEDQFTFKAGEKFQLDIYDARGRLFRSEEVALNNYGTINQNMMLPDTAPQGEYRVCLHRSSKGTDDHVGALAFETQFSVTEYRLEPIQMTIEMGRDVYFRGEQVTGQIELKYYYGTPLAGETIRYSFGPDAEQITATTNAKGKVDVGFETQRFSESQPLTLTVEYPDRSIATRKTVYLATRGFDISVDSKRDVYIAGETFEATFRVANPAGKSVGTTLKIEILEQTNHNGETAEKLVQTHEVETDADAGTTDQTLKLEDGGWYIVRATGTDQFGNEVSGQKRLRISGDRDSVQLRILADRHTLDVGEEAKIKLHWRGKPALALVTFEGASILGHQLVNLKKGNNLIAIPMNSKLAPNFLLSVAVMERNQFHAANSPFQVVQKLRVTLKPDRQKLKPGDNLTVDIEVTDSQGQPVQAELSLALVQSNLLNMFVDAQGAVDAFFSKGTRTPSLRQTTSCTFDYRPATSGVSEFLLAEMDRRTRLNRERRALGQLGNQADQFWSFQGVAGVAQFDVNGNGLIDTGGEIAIYIDDAAELSLGLSERGRSGYAGGMGGGGAGVAVSGEAGSDPNSWDGLTLNKFHVPQGGQASIKSRHLLLDAHVGRSPSMPPPVAVNGSGPGELESFNSNAVWFSQNDITINGLTAQGKFLALNGRDKDAIQKLIERDGLRLLPEMAHSETGFWDPTILTDDQGKARVVLTMPARSTAWQLRTKGINTESLAGEATAEVITQKELFGELKLPQAFVVGDKAGIPVDIHNSLGDKEQVIDVVLKTTFGDTSTEQKKSITVNESGISKLTFPVEIAHSENAVFELQVTGAGVSDTVRQQVTIRPDGFPVYATSSGTASQSTIAFVKFANDQSPTAPALEIVIGPSVNRSLLDAINGGSATPFQRCGLLQGSTLERCISDVMGGTQLLKMIGAARETDTPQAQALVQHVAAGISQIVSSQRDDGAWSWNGNPLKGNPDAYMTARILWALSIARESGIAAPNEVVAKGTAYLKTVFSKAAATDLELQTMILQSLAANNAGDFALANRLYRERNRLRQSGLIHLALALADMNHKEMAVDVLDMVRLSTEPATDSQSDRKASIPWLYNGAELRALYLLALQEINPASPATAQTANWLLAARVGSRWPVEKVNGLAVAGLARWHARTRHLSEKYDLTVSVNGRDLETLKIDPSKDSSRRIAVEAADLMGVDQEQVVEFKLQGRGTFSYSVVLTGLIDADKIQSTTRSLSVARIYQPALRMLDGKPIPRGFDVVNGSYKSFVNPLTQLPVGERAEVTLQPRRHSTGNPDDHGDYLVLTESIPSGCTVLDGSVSGSFERYELVPGQIRFYIGSNNPGDIHYTLIGYVPGTFTTPQTLLRSFYDPSHMAVATVKELQVLSAGSETVDAYKLTPDEQYHLGERHLAQGDAEQAHEHLLDLFNNWRLDNDKYKNVVQWLFTTSLAKNSHADTVRFFEIIKEKFSDVEVSFENILKVAQSYKEMSEYERSYLVYRATIQGNFERESQVTGFLNKRGEFLRSTQILEDLLADYPPESYVATATYALAQEVYRRAPLAQDDEKLKQRGVTRVHLIGAAIHMLDHFVTRWPSDPASDQASFAISTALIDLDQYEAAIIRCQRYAERFADSHLLDSFWYITGYSYFELENHEQALKICRKVADTTFPVPETGGRRPAQNKWEAVYIMGQVYHSLGKAAEAIAEYTQVRERFSDAAEAIEFFSRRDISLEEVVTIKPDDEKSVTLKYRNIAEAAIKVYRIDLMKFGLMQRNLDRITAINLAGIKPYYEDTLPLGDGQFKDQQRDLSLPLKEEGAYLVVCRGDNLYASGLVLVSPLTLSVQEDTTSGRVRVTVKDVTKDSFLDDVEVKVIGSANDEFDSGETDLRGLFVADDIKGSSTIIAMADNNRYAFFRGASFLQGVGQPVSQAAAQSDDAAAQPAMDEFEAGKDLLRGNIMNQNGVFQQEQQLNYGGLLNNTRKGIQSFEVDGSK